MFRRSVVPKIRCSEGSLLRRFVTPKLRFIVPKTRFDIPKKNEFTWKKKFVVFNLRKSVMLIDLQIVDGSYNFIGAVAWDPVVQPQYKLAR